MLCVLVACLVTAVSMQAGSTPLAATMHACPVPGSRHNDSSFGVVVGSTWDVTPPKRDQGVSSHGDDRVPAKPVSTAAAERHAPASKALHFDAAVPFSTTSGWSVLVSPVPPKQRPAMKVQAVRLSDDHRVFAAKERARLAKREALHALKAARTNKAAMAAYKAMAAALSMACVQPRDVGHAPRAAGPVDSAGANVLAASGTGTDVEAAPVSAAAVRSVPGAQPAPVTALRAGGRATYLRTGVDVDVVAVAPPMPGDRDVYATIRLPDGSVRETEGRHLLAVDVVGAPPAGASKVSDGSGDDGDGEGSAVQGGEDDGDGDGDGQDTIEPGMRVRG